MGYDNDKREEILEELEHHRLGLGYGRGLGLGYGRGPGLGFGRRYGFRHAGILAAGVALGSIGLKILTSRDARELYTRIIAAGLRAKEYTMDTVTNVQEHVEDMVEEAKFINRLREEDDEFGYDDMDWEDLDFEDMDFEDEGCTCGAADCPECNQVEEEKA